MAYSAARYFAPAYFDRYFQTGASSDPNAMVAALSGTGELIATLTVAQLDTGGDGGRGYRGRLKKRKPEDYNSARNANYRRQQGERDLLKVFLGEAPKPVAAKSEPKKNRNNVIEMALIMALLEDGDE